MRRIAAVVLSFLLLQVSAEAAERGTAEYERLKELKRVRREEKERLKASPSEKAKGFWAREAERSGFAGTGAMFSNAVFGTLSLDKPNSAKEKKS